LSDIDVRKSANALRAIWVAGNEYLQNTAPWATFKTDPDQAAAQVRLGLNLIGLYARLSAPFIPDTADKIKAALNMSDLDWPTDIAATLSAFKEGHAFAVPDNLFVKIDDDQRMDWETKFAGKRED
jgi:methionyl-tRNA synthetase